MQRVFRWLVGLLLFLGLFFFVVPVRADDGDRIQELQKTIEDLQNKINDAKNQQQSLSSAITVLNSQILLNQAKIQKTQVQITILESEIGDLGERIQGLESSLSDLSKILVSRVQAQYKQGFNDPVSRLFAVTGITELINEQRYAQQTRAHTENLLFVTEYKRQVYHDEKQEKEKKQAEVEALKKQLDAQQHDLDQQKVEKQQLLQVTKNNEQTYQKLLKQAQSELSSLRSFAVSRGGGTLPPQNSPDGWYFSQRDERWAGMCIGNSCGTRNQASVMEVGCLISSVAMVKKKYGEDVTPATIAANSSYFFSTTAYMLRPYPAPGGYRFENTSYSRDKLDTELREGRPVIVHLRVNTNDGHFVVIKSGENGDYTMHDPWEGYDKKFTDFYSTGQITEMAVLRQS